MRLGRSATKESLCGRKDLCLKFPCAHQSLYGASEARVMHNNSDGLIASGHARADYRPLSQNRLSLRYFPFGQTRNFEAKRRSTTFQYDVFCCRAYRARGQPERPRRACPRRCGTGRCQRLQLWCPARSPRDIIRKRSETAHHIPGSNRRQPGRALKIPDGQRSRRKLIVGKVQFSKLTHIRVVQEDSPSPSSSSKISFCTAL